MANSVKLSGYVKFDKPVANGGHQFALSVKDGQSGKYALVNCYASAGTIAGTAGFAEDKLVEIDGFLGFSFQDRVDSNGDPVVGDKGDVLYKSTYNIVATAIKFIEKAE